MIEQFFSPISISFLSWANYIVTSIQIFRSKYGIWSNTVEKIKYNVSLKFREKFTISDPTESNSLQGAASHS